MRIHTLLLTLAASLLVNRAATADDDISKDDGIIYLQSTLPGCDEQFNVFRVGNEIEIVHKALIDSQWVEINDKDYYVNGIDGIHFVGDGDSDGLNVNGWSSSAKVEVPVIAYGLGGSDTLRGGATQCILYGGPGVDVLIGTAGDDYLDPGEGVATVFGYGGANVFVVWQQYAWNSRLEEWFLEDLSDYSAEDFNANHGDTWKFKAKSKYSNLPTTNPLTPQSSGSFSKFFIP